MKKMATVFGTAFMALLFALATFSPAQAAGMMGKNGFGISVGGAFVTQDVDTDTEADPGLIVSINGTRGLSDNLVVGLGVDWETHLVKDTLGDIDLADVSTISIMPFAQWHFGMSERLSPYVLLGLGYNINSISESDDLETVCPTCSLDIDNTFAVKVGGGLDFSLTPNLSLNGELGYKMNSGEVEEETSASKSDANLSGVAVTVGIRFMM